jgi:hypothetical protein
MVYRESCGFVGDCDCVFFAEIKNAARLSYFDKHLGVGGTYYDEHQSADDGGTGSWYFYCSFYSRVAALLFQ